MVRLPIIAAALILPALALAQPTDDAAKCQAAAGSYLTGTVVSGPRFKPGAPLHGTYLSHTHLTLRGDADGRAYDVAIDNVFANEYRHNQRSVPAPLNTIKVGDRLELCGRLYTGGDVGINWVHTNCGVPPSSDKPDGWVREINKDGSVAGNMEAKQDFLSRRDRLARLANDRRALPEPSRYPAGPSCAPMPAVLVPNLTRRAKWFLRSSDFSRKA